MLEKTTRKIKKSWAFALAAASLPLSYILLLPCLGTGCASCPTGGACLLSAPLLIVLVLVSKSFTETKNTLRRMLNQTKPKNKHQTKTDNQSQTKNHN